MNPKTEAYPFLLHRDRIVGQGLGATIFAMGLGRNLGSSPFHA